MSDDFASARRARASSGAQTVATTTARRSTRAPGRAGATSRADGGANGTVGIATARRCDAARVTRRRAARSR